MTSEDSLLNLFIRTDTSLKKKLFLEELDDDELDFESQDLIGMFIDTLLGFCNLNLFTRCSTGLFFVIQKKDILFFGSFYISDPNILTP